MSNITDNKSYLDTEHFTGRRPKKSSQKPAHTEQRIVIKYRQDENIKKVVLLNYKETMARCRIIHHNSKILKPFGNTVKTDFLIAHRTYWRTQFKLTPCCIICGCDSHIENRHVRHIKKDIKAKGFLAVMAKLQRRQIPLCKWCHRNVHKGLYNSVALMDLYDRRIPSSENLIRVEGSLWSDSKARAEVYLSGRLVTIDPKEAYSYDEEKKTITCQYLVKAKDLNSKEPL